MRQYPSLYRPPLRAFEKAPPRTRSSSQWTAVPGALPARIAWATSNPRSASRAPPRASDDRGHAVDTRVSIGSVEDWDLINPSTMDHPFHLHTNAFQVVGSDGKPEGAWRDVVLVPWPTRPNPRALPGLRGQGHVPLPHSRSRGPRDDGDHRGNLAGRRSVRRILHGRRDDARCECDRSQHRARVDTDQVAGFHVPDQNHFDCANPIHRNHLEAGQD